MMVGPRPVIQINLFSSPLLLVDLFTDPSLSLVPCPKVPVTVAMVRSVAGSRWMR